MKLQKIDSSLQKFSMKDIISLFETRKGKKKAITQTSLFTTLAGHDFGNDPLKDIMIWIYIKRSLHYLRRVHPTIKPISAWNGNERIFYVPSSDMEAQPYYAACDNVEKRVREAKKRMKRFVSQQ